MESSIKITERMRVRLLRMRRNQKQTLMLAIDFVASSIGFLLAYQVVLMAWPSLVTLATVCLAMIILTGPAAYLVGLYRSVIRFVGVDLTIVAMKSTAISALSVFAIVTFFVDVLSAARIAFVFGVSFMVWLTGSRFAARLFMNRRGRFREPIVIYGAGQVGIRLAASLVSSPRFFPVAFFDDDPKIVNSRIDGLDVYPPENIERVIKATGAKRVLLAMPNASRLERRRIISRLEVLAVRVQTIPDVAALIAGSARVDDIRDVAVEDLLGRDPVPPNDELLKQENTGKVIMVTGAGGSIGSQLCLKILTLEPKLLLLFERSEIALYNIEKALLEASRHLPNPPKTVGLLGCVQDVERLEAVMRSYDVDTIYHAAAYKHVPIVEQNTFEGIKNNVFGTLKVSKAAIENGVSTFVLISTDKAVSPTNVMGASKRLAELVLQSLNKSQAQTKFCMVRFGNVLASSGSVVPLFREQIRAGGPVTVTHPEITRYFMTIPEAAELVIQAGALAEGGDVFVLDMGEPVKIVDLATKLIKLMGHEVRNAANPEGEIEIVFSGLRPAEKLYEELLIGSNVSGTSHPRIMRASEGLLDRAALNKVLDRLTAAISEQDWVTIREILRESVEGYRPTDEVGDHLFAYAQERIALGNVADIDAYR